MSALTQVHTLARKEGPSYWLLGTLLTLTMLLSGCSPDAQATTLSGANLATPVKTQLTRHASTTFTLTSTLVPATAPVQPPTATSMFVPSVPPTVGATAVLSSPALAASSTERTAPDLAQGIELYRKNYCGYCHTLPVAETHGIFGPAHEQMGMLAAKRIKAPNYSGTATTAAAYVYESLVDPQAYIVDGYAATRHPMPAYAHLSAAEIEALVYLLLQQ
jgi:hypothetical protein